MKFRWLPLILLALLLLLPALLREKPPVAQVSGKAAETLVIYTPHAESIKYEFERAFQIWYEKHYHAAVTLDWRSPGGTSDIVRTVNDRFEAAFRRYSEERGWEWNDAVKTAFNNPKVKPDDSENATPEARARARFLASDVSIGVDLLFGGGTYDHANQARKGYAVDAGIQKLHPEWFTPEVMPQTWSGETIYDPNGGYYGVCLATFGICYNPDRQRTVGAPPSAWRDLAQSAYLNSLVVADPTKSGSINKCFEVILQQCMAEGAARDKQNGAAAGWSDGLNLIRRLVGNSRAITESAGKVTREVASGNAAAGMAIDFYALSEAQFAEFQTAGEARRIEYVAPKCGSSVSADPVQMFRGAPNPKAARAFIEFLLSEEGQQLWQYRIGTPGGPVKYTLRRPPVRRDLYTGKHREFMADPDYNPYAATGDFVYHGEWTGRYFNLIRVLIRTTMLDASDELKTAWSAIAQAGGETAVPEAVKAFDTPVVPYEKASEAAQALYPHEGHTMADVIATRRNWTMQAIENYRRAAKLAKEGK